MVVEENGINLSVVCFRSVEHCFHMCDRVVIYFFIAASYTPWWVSDRQHDILPWTWVIHGDLTWSNLDFHLYSGWTCVNWAPSQHTCAGLCGSWLLLEPFMSSTTMKSELAKCFSLFIRFFTFYWESQERKIMISLCHILQTPPVSDLIISLPCLCFTFPLHGTDLVNTHFPPFFASTGINSLSWPSICRWDFFPHLWWHQW